MGISMNPHTSLISSSRTFCTLAAIFFFYTISLAGQMMIPLLDVHKHAETKKGTPVLEVPHLSSKRRNKIGYLGVMYRWRLRPSEKTNPSRRYGNCTATKRGRRTAERFHTHGRPATHHKSHDILGTTLFCVGEYQEQSYGIYNSPATIWPSIPHSLTPRRMRKRPPSPQEGFQLLATSQ